MASSRFPIAFSEVYLSLWRNRSLVRQMVRREVVGRYRGSFLGLLWSFVNPVLMLAVYTFVFSIVFEARWGSHGSGDKFEFALVLFVGLIVFNLFSECVTRAPNLILQNANYVKKVIFPLEILPWVSLGSSFFHAIISVVVLLVFLALVGHVGWTVVLLPLVVLPLLVFIMGLSWLLASVGVFIRDVGQFIGMVVTILMFMSPIFYPAAALPESVRGWLFFNPLTFIIEQAREVVVWGRLPDWQGLGLYLMLATLFAWAGLVWFQKTRKGFGDVL